MCRATLERQGRMWAALDGLGGRDLKIVGVDARLLFCGFGILSKGSGTPVEITISAP